MSGDLLGVALGVNRKTIYRWEVDPTNKEHTRVPIAVILLLRIWVKHPSWIPVTRRHKNRFRPVECFLGPTQRAEPEVASALAEGE